MNEPTILVDTDFHKYADDHEALRILAPGHRTGELTIAGITTVTGNAWASVCAEHASAAVNELVLDGVAVYQGAGQPLLHRQSDFAHRSRLYGAAFGGAWGNAELLESSPVSQPKPENGAGVHAVDYIIRTLRGADVPLAILALGPMTNLALAIRLAPDVVSKIGHIVAMGGAFFVAGNVTPSAEFNWWFDPEAAAIVLEQNIAVTIVPLDATDIIELDHARFQKWQSEYGDHTFFREFHEPKFSKLFENDSHFKLPVWDALAAACLLDESLITSSEDLWVTVDCSNGASYGRVVAFKEAQAFNLDEPGRPKARVVTKVDECRFWAMYESLVFAD
jgi:inosine-uridine nucleoside N-ribohydrolase